jgi:hypothetical protein
MLEKIRNSATWKWTKWLVLSAIAVGSALLMFLYGKKTTSGLMRLVAAHNAKGQLLNTMIAAQQKKAGASEDDKQRVQHLNRADTLKIQQADVEKERLRLLSESGDLVPDADVSLAVADNRRARRAG